MNEPTTHFIASHNTTACGAPFDPDEVTDCALFIECEACAEVAQVERHRRAMERGRMIERSRRLDAAARAGDLAEKRKVMSY